MIGREFIKTLRLLAGRSETIRTTFELHHTGQLVEHVTVETHDKPTGATARRAVGRPTTAPRARGR